MLRGEGRGLGFNCPPKGSRKKIRLLMARPLRPNPPTPSSLMAGRWSVGTLEKKVKKSYFFLMARTFTPPLNGPAIKRRTFFSASLSKKQK